MPPRPRPASVSDQHLYERALAWAQQRRHRPGGRNYAVVAVEVVRNTVADRLAGLAAEMAFWALLSLLPLLVTIASLLGYAGRLIGPDRIARGETAIVSALSVVFSPDVIIDVVKPFIAGLLRQGRGGVALTGLLVSLYLASRVFTATIRALDLAYQVPERRGLLSQRLIAMAMAIAFVVVGVMTLLVTVVGPLLGSGQMLADRVGAGGLFQTLWTLLRWPFLLSAMVLFLSAVYLWGPNVVNSFRQCLPGAILGVAAWTLASLGLRLYLAWGGGDSPVTASDDEAVALVGRVVGTLIAILLWTFLTGLAILLGGELNAELARHEVTPKHRHSSVVRGAPSSETMRSRD